MGRGESAHRGAGVSLRLIYKPEAEFDLAEAYAWYEARREGLGSEFLEEVASCARDIECHPQMFPAVHGNLRQGVLRRFPYSLFYLLSDDAIYIISVFHASRDPQIWQERV